MFGDQSLIRKSPRITKTNCKAYRLNYMEIKSLIYPKGSESLDQKAEGYALSFRLLRANSLQVETTT